ncbi:MAG: EamA family transporter [Rhizobiales bacterium]|nr:EamA family transporter [Hyphomicrobiales bacterium]
MGRMDARATSGGAGAQPPPAAPQVSTTSQDDGKRHAEQGRANVAAVGYLMIGIATFSLQDVVIKHLSGAYPVGQIILLRSLVQAPLLIVFALYFANDRRLSTRRPLLHFVRSLMMLTAYTTYYLAIAAMPLAEAVTIAFAAPIFITIFASVLLREPVGVRRWFGVLVGFAGVLVMMRPGAGAFEPAALFAVVAAMAYAGAQLMARFLGREDSSTLMAVYASPAYIILGAALGIAFGDGSMADTSHPSLEFMTRAWVWPPLDHLLMMLSTGIISAVGMVFLAKAYARGEASVVAAFEYTGLAWAVLWGALIWREWPDLWTLAGMTLLVGSGLYILLRERQNNRPIVAKPGRLRVRSGL